MMHDNKYLITGYFINRIIEFIGAGALGGAIVATCYGHQTCGWALLCAGMFANLVTDMLGREAGRLHDQLEAPDEPEDDLNNDPDEEGEHSGGEEK